PLGQDFNIATRAPHRLLRDRVGIRELGGVAHLVAEGDEVAPDRFMIAGQVTVEKAHPGSGSSLNTHPLRPWATRRPNPRFGRMIAFAVTPVFVYTVFLLFM